MDALTINEEKCKVLETKLHYTKKQVEDLLSEKAVARSCISDVTGLLSDIIETRDPMNSITVQKHLAKKLRSMFKMLHRLEGASKSMSFSQQWGEGGSIVQTNKPPKLQLTLSSSRKSPRVNKIYLSKNTLSIMKKTKRLMNQSLKGGRLARQVGQTCLHRPRG